MTTVDHLKRIAVVSALLLLVGWTCKPCSADELYAELDNSRVLADRSEAQSLWTDWSDPSEQFWTAAPAAQSWTIEYRFRTMFSSETSYEFGTSPDFPEQWTPLSRLKFPLNSCWHGLRLAKETPLWNTHFEWMTPQRSIDGRMEDYDWFPPNPDGSFTDLGYTEARWTDGQMLDIGFDFQLLDRPLGAPFAIWPTAGFRWQRFDIMCYNLEQVKSDNEWLDPPRIYEGDVLSFNQQYYTGYGGLQLRGKFDRTFLAPLVWTLQGDWGYTEAYNIDHHLIREGNRFTMERTHGDSWHISLTTEALLSSRVSLGLQADHLELTTRGTHHYLNEPIGDNETWSNGVLVKSHQTSLTAFLRLRI
jgi:hypothetical protein